MSGNTSVSPFILPKLQLQRLLTRSYREKMCLLGVGEDNGMEIPGAGGLDNELEAV